MSSKSSKEQVAARAEASFSKAQKLADAHNSLMAEIAREAKAVDDKTARLKALRLAKEAADAQAKADAPPVKPTRSRKKA